MELLAADTKERTLTIKDELPSLFFPQYHPIHEFTSDEESRLDSLQLAVVESSDSDDESCDFNSSSKKANKSRRNRRKPLLPQKTVQSEISQTGSSAGTSSECSQDAIMLNFADSFINSAGDEELLELADGDDLLRDIDEENIFKGIQEETGNSFLLL